MRAHWGGLLKFARSGAPWRSRCRVHAGPRNDPRARPIDGEGADERVGARHGAYEWGAATSLHSDGARTLPHVRPPQATHCRATPRKRVARRGEGCRPPLCDAGAFHLRKTAMHNRHKGPRGGAASDPSQRTSDPSEGTRLWRPSRQRKTSSRECWRCFGQARSRDRKSAGDPSNCIGRKAANVCRGPLGRVCLQRALGPQRSTGRLGLAATRSIADGKRGVWGPRRPQRHKESGRTSARGPTSEPSGVKR